MDTNTMSYFQQIGQIALLTSHEEQELGKAIATGREAETRTTSTDRERQQRAADMDKGAAARAHLVEANLRLVANIAKHYCGPMGWDDLIQEGSLGLLRAADKFDHTRGYRFSTYATFWIKQALLRALDDRSRSVRLPAAKARQLGAIEQFQHQWFALHGCAPDYDVIADAVQMTPTAVCQLLIVGTVPRSLDAEDHDGNCLGDRIAGTADPASSAVTALHHTDVLVAVSHLSEREQVILGARFGLHDQPRQTLEAIGQPMGLTRERVRQIERSALRKLRCVRLDPDLDLPPADRA